LNKEDNQQAAYSFDYIRIITKEDRGSLVKSLPIIELKQNCHDFYIIRASEKAQKIGYKSTLVIVAPSPKALETLLKCEEHLVYVPYFVGQREPYKISYLEIARDTPQRTEFEAERKILQLSKLQRMKWAKNNFVYNAYSGNRNEWNWPQKDDELFSNRTWYYGGDKFKFAMYPRISKIMRLPCVHEEWRMVGASTIKKKTGITNIIDLIEADLNLIFERLHGNYITYEKIDYERFGKWLLGLDGRRKFSEEQKSDVLMQGFLFCKTHEIESPADFVRVINEKKSEIKKWIGRKRFWQKRFLKVNPRKFLMPYNNI
jgi:hypothetical protein